MNRTYFELFGDLAEDLKPSSSCTVSESSIWGVSYV